ncbi:MAG: PP2C family serine/threonine-protein phosphatase [Methylocystis sp.]
MLTDIGRVRKVNEDSVAFVAPAAGTPEENVGFLALVADGMGGHAAGEIASALAAEEVRRAVYASDAPPPEALRAALESANRAILDYSAAHPDTRGMGTTCTAILVRGGLLWLAHVGDSRAYLLRESALTQFSDDQTLHAQLIREGVMTPEEAANSPGGNIILQALGARDNFEPTISERGLELRVGDIVLLCSDGLHNLVSHSEIARILQANTPQEACRELVEKALAAGGNDNISVGVFCVVAADPPRDRDQAATKPIKIVVGDAAISGGAPDPAKTRVEG